MSKFVLLDTCVLGLAINPKTTVNNPVLMWIMRLLQEGHKAFIPEIADYELRRELIRIGSITALRNLDRMVNDLDYLPISTEAMRQAAKFWAHSRSSGKPFAHEHALDGDVILCAQARTLAGTCPNEQVLVASTNVKHIGRYVAAESWQKI